jgi:hypothetical protein
LYELTLIISLHVKKENQHDEIIIKTVPGHLSPTGYRAETLSLGIKWLEHEADHSAPVSAEVKHAGSYVYISTPHKPT